MSFASMSAPLSRRREITSTWPLMAALWRGVYPPYNNNRETETGQVRARKERNRRTGQGYCGTVRQEIGQGRVG
jgi:hypothetical protein